jgi:hypothetical protein
VHCEECLTPIVEKDSTLHVMKQDKRIHYCSMDCLAAQFKEKEDKKVKDGK